ncbi:MAG: hypothetical protein ABI746_13440 [Dermatophilaceae bacterium]
MTGPTNEANEANEMDEVGDSGVHGIATDRERFAEALDIVTGGRGAGTLRRLAYPVYVTIMIGMTYGFTIARALFVASNPAWIRDHLFAPTAVVIGAAMLPVVAALVWRASRHRGAVVPPIAWTDQVLVSSIDRATAVRPWWHLTLAATTTGGGLTGALLGGSLWASTVTGPLALPAAAALGAVLGALLGHVALWGQARASRPYLPFQVLRRLRIDDLRAQAATGDHLIGALLAGDARAGQLEFTSPTGRGRALTLHAAGPVMTVIRRDMLGQRRDPFTFWRAAILSLLGAGSTVWAITEPATPAILACVGVLLMHIGTGAWSEGLRMSADQLGTPVLSGLTPRRQAQAHSIVPTASTLLAWIVASVVIVPQLSVADSLTATLTTLLAAGVYATVTTITTTWLATYRAPASVAVFVPSVGPVALLLRLAIPGVIAFIAGALLPSAAQRHEIVMPIFLLGAALIWASTRMTNATTRRAD